MLVVVLMLPLFLSMYDGEFDHGCGGGGGGDPAAAAVVAVAAWQRWKTIFGKSGRQRERRRLHDGMR
jgi:hypothetical protein